MFSEKLLSQFQTRKKFKKNHKEKKTNSKIKNFTKTKMGGSKAKKIRGAENGEKGVFLKF